MNNTPNAETAASRIPDLANQFSGRGVSAQFLTAGALGAAIVLALGFQLAGIAVFAGLVAYLVALWISHAALRRSYPHASIGFCNVVTMLRLSLTSALTAAIFAPATAPWLLFAVAAIAIALDGVDGWLARREGYTSDFGARFDMEVDAVLALVLAVHVYLGSNLGPLVILLGLPRYVFFFAQIPLPWLAGDLPPRFSRKVVCVVQMVTLLILLLPPVPAPVSVVVLGMTCAALIWSFGLDIKWLWRARG